jgi:hypothetical protein
MAECGIRAGLTRMIGGHRDFDLLLLLGEAGR